MWERMFRNSNTDDFEQTENAQPTHIFATV